MPPTAVAPRSATCAGDQRAERRKALGAQDRALGIDVVLGARAARQRHGADNQSVIAQLLHQLRVGIGERARISGRGIHAGT